MCVKETAAPVLVLMEVNVIVAFLVTGRVSESMIYTLPPAEVSRTTDPV